MCFNTQHHLTETASNIRHTLISSESTICILESTNINMAPYFYPSKTWDKYLACRHDIIVRQSSMSKQEARGAKRETFDAYLKHMKAKRREAAASIAVQKQIVHTKRKRGDTDLDYEDSRLVELTYAKRRVFRVRKKSKRSKDPSPSSINGSTSNGV